MRWVFLFIISLAWSTFSHAQAGFQLLVDEALGTDQQLINGVQFSNQSGPVEGHPYLFDERFRPSDLQIRGTWYRGIPVRYNLYTQRIELRYLTSGGHRNQIIAVPQHLHSLSVSGIHFQYMELPGTAAAYYQVVGGEFLDGYVRWTKAMEPTHGRSKLSHRYSAISTSYWILSGNGVHRFHNRRTLLNAFPPEVRKIVDEILREHRIFFRKETPQEAEEELRRLFQLIDRAGITPFLMARDKPQAAGSRREEPETTWIRIDSSRLISRLPDYVPSPDTLQDGPLPEETATPETESGEPGNTESRYMNGRRVREPVTIRVGSAGEEIPGRKVLINGTIVSSASGEPVIGATVYIPEVNLGTSTNTEGGFDLVIRPGTYYTECHSMGMETFRFNLLVESGGRLKIRMEPALIPLEEVVVRAEARSRVRSTSMGMERLNYRVLKDVPLVMGENDILNLVKLLPGVQSSGEGAAGFQVRGSSMDQNMIYLNKVPVYNSSHLFGFFSAFNPGIISDFTLYKGNAPASYGGRLASFFDIRTRQGNMKRFAARGGISLVSAYAAAEGPVIKDKSSIQVSGRSTYSDWILRRLEDPLLRSSKAGFNDYSLNYTHLAGERTRISLFGYSSNDRFKLGNLHSYVYGNRGASLNLNHRFNRRLTGDFAVVYSRYRFSNSHLEEPSTGYQHTYRIDHYEGRTDLKWISLGMHTLTFGAGGIYYHLDRGIIGPYGSRSLRSPIDLGVDNGVEMAIYGADEIDLTSRLTLYAGLRLSAFLSLGPSTVRSYMDGAPTVDENVTGHKEYEAGSLIRPYLGWEPRINARYLAGDHSSLKLSYARGYQYLFMLSNTVAMAPSDQWKLSDYHIGPQYMDQLSAGYFRDFSSSGFTGSVELYRKWGHRIVDFRDWASFTESPYAESEVLQGDLDAWGMELMLKKASGAINGWISYSYSRSFMRVNLVSTGEQINLGKQYPSLSDRPHSVSLVANLKGGRRMSFSANLIYNTGRPTTYPVSLYYEYEIPYLQYSERNRYRIPDYFRIDVSVNFEGNLKREKLFHSYWMLGIYNLTGRMNTYSVFFRNVRESVRGYQLSIFAQPIVTLSWNLKLGNYATE